MARKILALLSLSLISIFIGCGGSVPVHAALTIPPTTSANPTPTPSPSPSPSPSPTPTPPPLPATVLSASVLNMGMIGQCWDLMNVFGDKTSICVEAPQAMSRNNADGSMTAITWTDPNAFVAGRGGNNLVLHFTKNTCEGYWDIGACNAELWFPLHQNDDESWRSTTSLINVPGQAIVTFTVQDDQAGMPLPYLIAPPTISSTDHFINETRAASYGQAGLTFNDTRTANAPLVGPAGGEYWKTEFYIVDVATPVYSGPVVVSEQWEGDCGHEIWQWAPATATFSGGILSIQSLNDGGEIKNNTGCALNGDPLSHDTRSTIVRTH